MSDNNPSITLCMIVQDEEKNLELCINSIKPHINEIIIVDTGSKDKTVQIAKDLGAKVFHFVWGNNFSAARNFALQQATGDWVLNLDASDLFISKKPDVLKKWVKKNEYLGLLIGEHHADANGKFDSVDKLLLFKNHYGFEYSGLIYESPMNSIKDYAVKNKINVPYDKITECRIEHINNIDQSERFKRKLKILNLAIKQEPDNFHYVYKKLLVLDGMKKKKEYEKILLKAVYDIEKKKPGMSESVVGIWGQFGEWILKGDNSSHVEHFYKSATELITRTKFSDIRLVWPYVKVSIIQKNYNKAIKDLTNCIKNGIVPQNAPINKTEKIIPVYQLLKLVNDEKSLEDFATLILDLPDLLHKSTIKVSEVLNVLQSHDPELYESVQDIMGDYYKANENKTKKTIRLKKANQKPLISLCMIVKNEQENIARCLSSVKGIADEIIIVDTGSEDKSIKIAEQHGAKVISINWTEDFSEARNTALNYAKGRWILHLDADEELHISTKEKIKSILKKTKAEGINIILRNHQPTEEIIRYLDMHQVRMFRNKPNYRYRERVNEQIISSIAEAGGSFTESRIIINNYGSLSRDAKRYKRVIPIYSEGLREDPRDANLLFKLGETYKSLNKWNIAEKYYIQALSNPRGNINNEIKELIYLRLAQISMAKEKYSDAKNYSTACLRFNRENAMAKYILAVTYMYLGNTDASVRLFIELKRTQKNHGLDLVDIESYLEALADEVEDSEKVMN